MIRSAIKDPPLQKKRKNKEGHGMMDSSLKNYHRAPTTITVTVVNCVLFVIISLD